LAVYDCRSSDRTERYRLPCLVGGIAGKPRRDVAAEQQIMDAALRRSEDAVTYRAEHYRRTSAVIEASIDWPALAQAARPSK
jgi:GntR family carbon starvation induced transcriptional regulator